MIVVTIYLPDRERGAGYYVESPITRADVRTLGTEASTHGDHALAEICDHVIVHGLASGLGRIATITRAIHAARMESLS